MARLSTAQLSLCRKTDTQKHVASLVRDLFNKKEISAVTKRRVYRLLEDIFR